MNWPVGVVHNMEKGKEGNEMVLLYDRDDESRLSILKNGREPWKSRLSNVKIEIVRD